MTDSYFSYRLHNKSPSLTENERIAKLRTKISSAQKTLQLSQSSTKDEIKPFSFCEESNSKNKNIKSPQNILRDSSNIPISDANQFDHKTNEIFKTIFMSKPLSLEDLNSIKDIELGELRQKTLQHILEKVETYKKNPADRKALLETEFKSLKRAISSYYNYIEESDSSVLIYLITTLYREIEILCQSSERAKSPPKDSKKEYQTQEGLVQGDSQLNLTINKKNPMNENEWNKQCQCKIFLAELKEYFKVVNQGLLCSHKDVVDALGKNYYEMTSSILKKFNQADFGPLSLSQSSPQPGSIIDLFTSNKQTSNDRKAQSHSENSYSQDIRISDLLREIEKLKKENEEMNQHLFQRSRVLPKDFSSIEGSLVLKELKKVIQEKETLENECRNLKRILHETEREFREEREQDERMSQEGLNQIDIELQRARNQIASLLEKKEIAEKQAFVLKVDKDDLLERIKAYELKLKISNDHNEATRKQIIINEEIIQEKTQTLEKLKFDHDELETQHNILKSREKEFERNIKQRAELDEKINKLKEEVNTLKQSLDQTKRNLESAIDEKEFIKAKYETLDSFNPKYADPHIIEQISSIVIGRLTQPELNNETKAKLQKMFGEKFVYLLSPLKKKLKKLEMVIKEIRKKYQEKINQYIDKVHEVESLSGLLLQAHETISNAVKSHSLVGIGLLNEELQRKKIALIGNIENGEKEKEDDLRELTKIYEESVEESDTQAYDTIPNFSFPDAENLLKENDSLKAQIQEQNNEISTLSAQLKFANNLEENRKKYNASRSLSYTDRMGRSFNKRQEISYDDEEEETLQSLKNVSKSDEIYLMLRAQASSLELLLTNME